MSKKIKYYDPLAEASTEHWIDENAGKFYTRTVLQMDRSLEYAKEKRAACGDRHSIRACDLGFKKGHLKPMGVMPISIYHEHPEFMYDMEAVKKWFRQHPYLKTTNKEF